MRTAHATVAHELNRAVRVITGWVRDPDFLDEDLQPKELPLRNGTTSFEHLVARYSGGITVRAILDELIRVGAVIKLEKSKVKLSIPTAAVLGTNTSIVTILDDDPPPSVNFQQTLVTVKEGGGAHRLLLALNTASGLDITVPYRIASSATPNVDYRHTGTSASIPAGATQTELTIKGRGNRA